MKRKEGEKFKSYQSRRKADKILTKIRSSWKFVWFSTGVDKKGKPISQTYVKGRDKLINSRDGTAPDAPKRPAGNQAHNNKYMPNREDFLSTSENPPDVKHTLRIPTAEHPDVEIYQKVLPFKLEE